MAKFMSSPLRVVFPILTLLVALTLIGCEKENAGAAASTPTAAPAAQTSAAQPAADSVVDAVTGVAECDRFLHDYRQCVSANVPAASRAAVQTGLDQWSKSWKEMAANPATKESLPQICAQARSATQASAQAYGCTL